MQRLPLSRGLFALVDDDDFPDLLDFRWSAKPCGPEGPIYAVTNIQDAEGRWRLRSLHRLLLDPPADREVIFADYNGLNCQRSNLRIVDKVEAGRHHRVRRDSWTGLKGVRQDRTTGFYVPLLTVENRIVELGQFEDADEATEAYDEAVKTYYGETAPLHRPGPGRQSARRPWLPTIPPPDIRRPRKRKVSPDIPDRVEEQVETASADQS